MSETLWNDEWPMCNSARAYPLRAGCSRISGQFTLPPSLIVDASIVLPRVGGLSDPTKVHVYQVAVLGTGIILTIGYNNNPIAVIPIPGNTPIGMDFELTTLDGYEALSGTITVGTLTEALSSPGVWPFTVDTARFEPTVVRVAPNSVQALHVVDSSGITSTLRGEVYLRAGSNARILAAGSTATIDALGSTGAGFSDDCNCDTVRLGTPITRINGIGPTASGAFSLEGVGCADIQASNNGLLIDDKCASPCCGCEELNQIVDKLREMTVDVDSMRVATSALGGVINQLAANLAACKIQD